MRFARRTQQFVVEGFLQSLVAVGTMVVIGLGAGAVVEVMVMVRVMVVVMVIVVLVGIDGFAVLDKVNPPVHRRAVNGVTAVDRARRPDRRTAPSVRRSAAAARNRCP